MNAHSEPQLLDVVAVLSDFPEHNLVRGQVGAVVVLLDGRMKSSSATTKAKRTRNSPSRPISFWSFIINRNGLRNGTPGLVTERGTGLPFPTRITALIATVGGDALTLGSRQQDAGEEESSVCRDHGIAESAPAAAIALALDVARGVTP